MSILTKEQSSIALKDREQAPEQGHSGWRQTGSRIALSDWLKDGNGRQPEIVTRLINLM